MLSVIAFQFSRQSTDRHLFVLIDDTTLRINDYAYGWVLAPQQYITLLHAHFIEVQRRTAYLSVLSCSLIVRS